MRAAALFFWMIVAVPLLAQRPEVPHKIEFAGMTLTIRDDARREIQKDVDAFTQSPKHFGIKADRARTYFPIIEKIFAEERVPDDFKYLVLQESALIADAVSTSNAVGFWQFKDFTAIEMGLRVDKEIDERMNIVSATRAAAKYIKKNNFYFNNWLYALQAYQMGAGGVMQNVKDYQSGTRHMEITSRTYWYVKKFLAHKIAYEHAVKGLGQVKVLPVETKAEKTLADIAREFSVQEEELKSFNKWVRREKIPADRTYVVLIPATGDTKALEKAIAKVSEKHTPVKTSESPTRMDAKPAVARVTRTYIQGIPAIQAEAGETVTTLAKRAEVDISYFLRYNDIAISDPVVAGQYYFIERKNTRAPVQTHKASQGETLWSISQRYAIQLKKIKRYNRTLTSGPLPEGTVVVLSTRKIAEPVVDQGPVVEVSTDEQFTWSATPVQASASTIPSVLVQEPVVAPTNTTQARTTPVVEAPEGKHVVVAGETLYSICKRYGVNVMDVVAWNQLNLEAGIKEGQVLQVKSPDAPASEGSSSASETDTTTEPSAPANETPPGETVETVYEVKASDTLYGVARKFGVTIKELMDWNQKKDFSLVPGEKLRILKKP